MIAAIQLKIGIVGAGIFSIVICKLSYWQEPDLIVLLKINKDLKIYFYYTILIFGLVINFRVKCSKKSVFDFKKIIKQ